MSSAPVSPHGFVAVRGRGYRPDQVERFTAALCRDRDAAWERAARLTVLAKEMEAEAGRLRETVAGLAPQTYDSLGERARTIFRLGLEEAAAVRDRARREAREEVARAEAHALVVRQEAEEEAEALRADAEERARQRLLAARAEADEIRVSTRREVKEGRAQALAALREMRHRTAAVLADQHREHTERWTAAERGYASRAAALDARHAQLVARAEAGLCEAEQAFAEAEESARRRLEEAHARAAELVAEARVREERIARETERVLREHGERWDDVQAHMDHVRSSLAALTGGRMPAE
ncbi:cellulose-binding protein [Streptomyces sp. enrichment culture]|uniref:cellulose-binding protein n=1 Tax=Streptomyces sp. enrichment culture TaxID=1795815 RepID=UPI003F559E76